MRTKKDKYYQKADEDYQLLSTLGLVPGTSFYLADVNLTKQKGFGKFNLVGFWSKKTTQNQLNEGLYLITNLESVEKAVQAYKSRYGIKAMFKDCQSGGYNLEKCQAKDERLINLVLLITIAYSCTIFLARENLK